MSIAVLGGGAFGTALAIALSATGPVTLWARDPAAVRAMRTTRAAPRLPGCPLPAGIAVTDALDAASGAETLLLAVPMQALSGLLGALGPGAGRALVACCKGIDLATLRGPTALIAEARPDATAAILTGPAFAADLGRGLPTALTLASTDAEACAALQAQLSTPALRLYRSGDPVGAELGGALKNVVAIACGAAIGLGLGDSARAALMTRGFAEMTRLADHLGADPATLRGLSGLGDLALTCHSPLSRNFRLGAALGAGESGDADSTVEGVATAAAVARIATRDGLDLPICAAVHDLARGADARAAMHALLNRPLKEE